MAVRRADRRQADDVLAADQDLACRRILVAGDHAQDRGLAAAGRPEQAAIGAVGNLEIDAVDGLDDAVEALDDAGELDMAGPQFHAIPLSKPGHGCARRFWICAMVPRQSPMIRNEMIVVTVPSA